MIRLFATKEELGISSSVARSVDLISVSLVKISFANTTSGQDIRSAKLHMDMGKPISRFEMSARNTLLVFTNVRICGYLDRGEDEGSVKKISKSLQINVEFVMDFKLPEGEIPPQIKEKGFLMFAKLNGPYVCWPYVRQVVHSTMAAANISNVTLPLLTVVEKKPKADKKAVVEKPQ
jgi:hypothetical protein